MIRADIPLIERVSHELSAMLGEDFDAETFWDSLDGETDAMDLIGHLIRQREEAGAFAAAAAELAKEYGARKSRLEAKAKALSAALGDILDATGQRKVEHPLGTVSRTKGRARVVIDSEDDIPSQLTVTTVKPDAAAIKKQLEAGEDVPGAHLETGPDGLMVRVR